MSKQGLLTRYKPRMRPLPAGGWWCTWHDGSIGFGKEAREAYAMAKASSEFKDRLDRARPYRREDGLD